MLARPCECVNPLVFDDADTCTRCGRDVPLVVSPSTERLALVLARYLLSL